jgi:hypothetical protein
MNASGNRYIFCVSPGRSGTHYLQQVFSCAKGVCAVHEPEHQFPEYAHLKPHLWDLRNTPLASTASERRHAKLAQVNGILASTGAGIYAETNPLFSTLWHDVLLDALSDCDLTVIILRRNASAVLKSLLDLGWFQGRDGDRWMVTAYSVNSPLKAPVSEGRASAAELIIGYLLNVESNARLIKRRCEQQGHGVIELYSQQLFEEENAIEMLLSRTGLEPDMERLARLNTESRNKQTISKKSTDTPVEACRAELDHYLDSCRENAIDIPDLYYL